MSDNFLPSGENITLLNAELYFKADGDARAKSLGFVDSFSWTPTIEKAEKRNGNSGVSKTVASIVRSVSVEISMILAETTARNMAIALQGSIANLVQAAVIGATKTEANVKPGELIDLGALQVSNVEVSNGAATLVNGVDYVLNAEAGTILIYTAQASITITYDAAEILEADGKAVVKVLDNQQGIKGVFTLVGTNQRGKRYKFDGVRAELTPSGEVAFITEDGDFQSIELTGLGVENPLDPVFPYGKLTQLN